MVANPNWPEIQQSTYENQPTHERDDLIVRVFREKVNELKKDLKQRKVKKKKSHNKKKNEKKKKLRFLVAVLLKYM